MSHETQPLHQPVIIGICGGSGSGKTALTQRLVEDRQAKDIYTLVLQDNYYKHCPDVPMEQRRLFNFDHPDAIDFQALFQDIRSLKRGQSIQCPTYDFATHLRTGTRLPIHPKQRIILEGTLIFTQKKLLDLIDIKVFVDAEEPIRFERRKTRDINERGRTEACVKTQFESCVAPMHNQFIQPSAKYADLLIDGTAVLETSQQQVRKLIEHWLKHKKV